MENGAKRQGGLSECYCITFIDGFDVNTAIAFDICQKRAVCVIDRGHYYERWLPGIYILYVVRLMWIGKLI